MNLIFTYLKTYMGQEINLGINLSSKNKIEYDPNDKTIMVTKYSSNTRDFYSKNINELKIIVGANGAGKTSLFEVLSTPRKDFDRSTKYFSIYEVEGNQYFIEGSDSELLPHILSKELNKSKHDFYLTADFNNKQSSFEKINFVDQDSEFLRENVIVYFCPSKTSQRSLKRELDIGLRPLRYLVNEYAGNYEEFNYIKQNFGELSTFSSHFFRQLEVRLTKNSIETIELDEILDFQKFKLYGTNKLLTSATILGAPQSTVNFANIKEEFIISFLEGVITNLWHNINDEFNFSDYVSFLEQEYLKATTIDMSNSTYIEIVKYLKEIIVITIRMIKKQIERENSVYESLNNREEEIFQEILESLEKFPVGYYEKEKLSIPFELKICEDKTLKSFFQAMDSYSGCFADFIGLRIFYPSFSSGETQLIRIISGLESISKRLSYSSKKIIVLLDEPDTFIHPEWSRKLIYLLIETLKKFDSIDYDLFLTTNKPFMLSDVLPQDIIQIIPYTEGKKIIRETQTAKFGFGSNIFDILDDSFFLEALFGEFASKKIDKLIEHIEEIHEYDKKEFEQYETLISYVGDSIVRDSLLIKLRKKKESFISSDSNFFFPEGKTFSDTEEGIKEAIKYLRSKLENKESSN